MVHGSGGGSYRKTSNASSHSHYAASENKPYHPTSAAVNNSAGVGPITTTTTTSTTTTSSSSSGGGARLYGNGPVIFFGCDGTLYPASLASKMARDCLKGNKYASSVGMQPSASADSGASSYKSASPTSTATPSLSASTSDNSYNSNNNGGSSHSLKQKLGDLGRLIQGRERRRPQTAHEVETKILKKYLHGGDKKLRKAISRMSARRWVLCQTSPDHTKRVLEVMKLDDLFEGVITIEGSTLYWDNYMLTKKSFLAAQKAVGVASPDLCYYIDDNIENIKIATELGWNTVHVCEKDEDRNSGGRGGMGIAPLAMSGYRNNFASVKSLKRIDRVLPGLYS
ncbi:hypothetical protein H4219_002676 [Mycoemilia scoparia]|uniref:Uncharacterized protein n=1 Tax=Mycoemilia scoparia TaxID=417184 RepID=A0A9W8A4Z8_9FUNG|nr:hypothetical protein H4219_002676 [Mycoemilia scoparia]